ncbi:MAG: KUP/HAK/KT family potassium transporter [Planctomycetaceae bacterium]
MAGNRTGGTAFSIAVEGLSIATLFLSPYIDAIAIAILVALFYFQHKGTAGVGAVFGPVMLLWFAVLAMLGAWHI